jgi:type III restriction enzyme
MLERQTFQNKDLVLRVSTNYNPMKFDSNRYESFLDALCGDREYQIDAIFETIRYFLGGEYQSIKDLAEENYNKNPKLQDKYSSFDEFVSFLQLPNKLVCSLDHATGTGKSYIMYGIARILLSEGTVDQVLVLCPSNTIETGLTDKFRVLSSDRVLKDLLPTNSVILNPRIINASNTIQKGDICIENIHATYINTKSAIEDSLTGKGKRTLILNDEAHHLMSPSDTALKKWKEFLIDIKYDFKFIVNVSGTCYIGDDYFTDVIHRFSLRDAIDKKFVKSIRYIAEDSPGNENEKFLKIYDNHRESKIKYRDVKPITILITKDISGCKRLTEKIISFLSEKENITRDDAAKKVLIVTSSPAHKNNLESLRAVDEINNNIEWITSVSMLSEGWDVKNVFQIVPHEERAFNSKLLIAQVLGRGLRIPERLKGTQPVVTIFNHDKWSYSIKHLVDEVLEIEKRIISYPIEKKENYNFFLWNIRYKRSETERTYPQEDSFNLLKKGFINYSSQTEMLEKDTTYIKVITGELEEKRTLIEFKMHSVNEVAHDVFNRLFIYDQEAETNYSSQYTETMIVKIIKKSLEKIYDNTGKLSDANRNKTLAAFGVIRRKGSKNIRFKIEEQDLVPINTKGIGKNSIGIGSLRRDYTLFWDDYSISDDSIGRTITELVRMKEDGEPIDLVKINNKYNFKTPLNVVLSSSKPERKFIQGLIKDDIAKVIDAWIKSLDIGFYSIEFSWRKGEHPKQGSFNPDFFIKMGSDIIVVEIKMDNDDSNENRAKLRYSKEHFKRVNELQNDYTYYFKILSPISYDLFFKSLINLSYGIFVSELEAKLDE